MGTSESMPGVTTQEVVPGVRTMRGVKPLTGFLIGKFPAGDELVPTLVGGADLGVDWGGLVVGSAFQDAANFLAQGNRDLYICRVKGTASHITIKGQETPTPADKLTLTAKVDGTWADYAAGPPKLGIEAVVEADTPSETFKLTLNFYYKVGTTQGTYTEVFRQLSLESANSRYFPTYVTANSKLVIATDEAPASHGATNVPDPGTYALATGAEPDYSDGIAAIDQVAGRLCVFMDTDDDTHNAELVTAVNTRSGTASDRKAGGSICVLNQEQGTSVGDMATAGGAISENRAKLMGAWMTVSDPATGAVRSVRPAAQYAGVRCALPYYKSCTNKKVNGVVGCDIALTEANQLTLFQAGVCQIGTPSYDPNAGWVILTDEMTDGGEAFVRQIKDYEVAMGLANLGWVVGENQGEADPDPTRVAVVGMFAANYEGMKVAGVIERYSVQCDADNNPVAQIEQKILKLHREVKYRNVVNSIVDELVAGTESVIAREL